MLEMLYEIKAIDLATGACFVLTGLLLIVSYLPTPIAVRRWSVILSLVSIAAAMRFMMMSYYGRDLSLQSFAPWF